MNIAIYIILGILIVAGIIWFVMPENDKPADISKCDAIWKRMYYNGKFCGYIRLYPESLDILEEIKEEGNGRNFEFKELLEEDYI